MLSLTPPRPAHGGVSSFGQGLNVKPLAYSLIVFSSLWFVFLSAQPENSYDDYYADRPLWGKVASAVTVLALLLYPIAGWILSGTSNPRETWPHRLILTFASGVAAIFLVFLIMMSTMALRDWLWPLPPLPEKD